MAKEATRYRQLLHNARNLLIYRNLCLFKKLEIRGSLLVFVIAQVVAIKLLLCDENWKKVLKVLC